MVDWSTAVMAGCLGGIGGGIGTPIGNYFFSMYLKPRLDRSKTFMDKISSEVKKNGGNSHE